jgi:hypothetical protein
MNCKTAIFKILSGINSAVKGSLTTEFNCGEFAIIELGSGLVNLFLFFLKKNKNKFTKPFAFFGILPPSVFLTVLDCKKDKLQNCK